MNYSAADAHRHLISPLWSPCLTVAREFSQHHRIEMTVLTNISEPSFISGPEEIRVAGVQEARD